MALRIGIKPVAAPAPEETPQPKQETPYFDEESMEQPSEDTPEEKAAEGDKGQTDKQTAGYMGPESGPFQCGNCTHFSGQEQGSCDIVAGSIDPEGCCNLFHSRNAKGAEPTEQEPMPEEAQAPEEEPTPEEEY
jgi:hypothetical protein